MSATLFDGSVLLLAAVAVPLALLALCVARTARPTVLWLLPLAPLPALAAALQALTGSVLTVEVPALRLGLRLDAQGALLLCPAALLWCLAGAWTVGWLRAGSSKLRFVVCWLLTLVGSLGIFAAADLPGFYLFFALVSLPAYGLIIHDDTVGAERAGAVYIAFAVLGEALLLMGFVLMAAGEPGGSLQIRDIQAALPSSPWRVEAVALTGAGLLFKTASIPVHVWMPLAYTAAPIPAAAVLSGAAVKAGVIGLLRFLPLGDAVMAPVLVMLGLASAFYGVAVGLTQSNPRTVLAYSSISQMGVIATILGMGWAAADPDARLDAAFYASHHVLAKGGLFLAVGVMAGRVLGDRGGATLVLAAVLALGLGGLPLTGGALAKQVAKSTLGGGLVGGLALVSTVGTTVLMMHFLAILHRGTALPGHPAPDTAGRWSWRIAAVAAIGLPWLLFGAVSDDPMAALGPAAMLTAAWPVAVGISLWFVLARWINRLPRVPAGDLLVTLEAAFRALPRLGSLAARLDLRLRSWPIAGLSLLAVAIVLTAATALRD